MGGGEQNGAGEGRTRQRWGREGVEQAGDELGDGQIRIGNRFSGSNPLQIFISFLGSICLHGSNCTSY